MPDSATPALHRAQRAQPGGEREPDVAGHAHGPPDVVPLGRPPVAERRAHLDAVAVTVLATEPQPVDIPYDQIVRGNLIDEGSK